MPSVEQRVAQWFGLVSDLLLDLSTEMPRAQIADALRSSFDVTTVSWQWQDDESHFGFEAYPMPDSMVAGWRRIQQEPSTLGNHPLLRWFTCTGDLRPQSLGRVPQRVGPRQPFAEHLEGFEHAGCEQQLSIPYQLGPFQHRAFLLFRHGRDFDDDDLEVTRYLQKAFRALDRQSRVLAGLTSSSRPEVAVEDVAGLTGRETAVLSLLASGHTSFGIAQRLCVSPRTVQKHLEHIYRKLQVADRVGAIRAADEMRLLALNPGGSGPAGRAFST